MSEEKQSHYYKLLMGNMSDADDWEWIGGNGTPGHLNRWKLVMGDAEQPAPVNECICTHEIVENCYVRSVKLGEIRILGNCCIRRYMTDPEDRKLRCTQCGSRHSSRKKNICKGCKKERQRQEQEAAARKCTQCGERNRNRKEEKHLCTNCYENHKRELEEIEQAAAEERRKKVQEDLEKANQRLLYYISLEKERKERRRWEKATPHQKELMTQISEVQSKQKQTLDSMSCETMPDAVDEWNAWATSTHAHKIRMQILQQQEQKLQNALKDDLETTKREKLKLKHDAEQEKRRLLLEAEQQLKLERQRIASEAEREHAKLYHAEKMRQKQIQQRAQRQMLTPRQQEILQLVKNLKELQQRERNVLQTLRRIQSSQAKTHSSADYETATHQKLDNLIAQEKELMVEFKNIFNELDEFEQERIRVSREADCKRSCTGTTMTTVVESGSQSTHVNENTTAIMYAQNTTPAGDILIIVDGKTCKWAKIHSTRYQLIYDRYKYETVISKNNTIGFTYIDTEYEKIVWNPRPMYYFWTKYRAINEDTLGAITRSIISKNYSQYTSWVRPPP